MTRRAKATPKEERQLPSRPLVPMPKPSTPNAGLVFHAKWSDGIETQMSIYSRGAKPDIARAVAVSRAAYSSRKRVPMADITAMIVQAHFKKDGAVVATYTSEELPQ
jgi:hypothetical protein